MIKIRRPKDFSAGLFFMALGLSAIWIARGYPMGTAGSMGPGYFPIVVGGLLAAIGLSIAVIALAGESEPFPLLVRRPLILIPLSIFLFGLLMETLGLVLTTMAVILVSGLAGMTFRWLEGFLLGVLLAILSAVLFVYGLGLTLPLWPRLGG